MRTDATETAGGPLSRPYTQVTLAALALVTIVAFESMAVKQAGQVLVSVSVMADRTAVAPPDCEAC